MIPCPKEGSYFHNTIHFQFVLAFHTSYTTVFRTHIALASSVYGTWGQSSASVGRQICYMSLRLVGSCHSALGAAQYPRWQNFHLLILAPCKVSLVVWNVRKSNPWPTPLDLTCTSPEVLFGINSPSSYLVRITVFDSSTMLQEMVRKRSQLRWGEDSFSHYSVLIARHNFYLQRSAKVNGPWSLQVEWMNVLLNFRIVQEFWDHNFGR